MEKQMAKNRYLAFFIFDYLRNKMCADFLFKIVIFENLTQKGHYLKKNKIHKNVKCGNFMKI
jgi:hypothetical protein